MHFPILLYILYKESVAESNVTDYGFIWAVDRTEQITISIDSFFLMENTFWSKTYKYIKRFYTFPNGK